MLVSEDLSILSTMYVKYVNSKRVLFIMLQGETLYTISHKVFFDFNDTEEIDEHQFNFHFIRAMSSFYFDDVLPLEG